MWMCRRKPERQETTEILSPPPSQQEETRPAPELGLTCSAWVAHAIQMLADHLR